MPTAVITHPRCGKQWTGNRTAHCTRCCQTFSGTSAFDEHWKQVQPGEPCREPSEVGLVGVERSWGVVWSWPTREAGWAAWNLPDADESDAA